MCVRRPTLSSTPPNEIVWDCPAGYPFWDGTRISWSTETSERGTKVAFRHTGSRTNSRTEYDLDSFSLNWGLIAARLKEVVESGGTPNPFLLLSLVTEGRHLS